MRKYISETAEEFSIRQNDIRKARRLDLNEIIHVKPIRTQHTGENSCFQIRRISWCSRSSKLI